MKRKSIIILFIFLLLIIVSFYFDSLIIKDISFMRTNLLDNFFLGITLLSPEIIIFFFLTSLFLWQERKRKWILPLWFILGISSLISLFLKIAIKRSRPFQTGIVSLLPALQNKSYLLWNFSFPSFQAMLVFSAIPILSKEFPKFKYVWIILAGLVAFSRVYFGVHYLSDVLVGGLIGYLIGIFVIKQEKENKFWERIYEKISKKRN